MKKIYAVLLILLLILCCFTFVGCQQRVNIKDKLQMTNAPYSTNNGDTVTWHLQYRVSTNVVDLDNVSKIVITINGKRITTTPSGGADNSFSVEYTVDADYSYRYPKVSSCYAYVSNEDDEDKVEKNMAGSAFVDGIILLVVGAVARWLSCVFRKPFISYIASAWFIITILNYFFVEKMVAGGIILVVMFLIHGGINGAISRYFDGD